MLRSAVRFAAGTLNRDAKGTGKRLNMHAEDGKSGTETGSTWEASIDGVATRLLVEGIHAGTLADLRLIGEDAGRNGFSDLAQRAATLASSLEAADEQEVETLLKSGITDLRLSPGGGADGVSTNARAPYQALEEDVELIADFLVEAREHLSQIEGQMLSLERDPTAMEVIHAVFRAFHTIKGLAGFLGFATIQAVAHEVETLLDLARNEKLRIDTAIVDVVLESADFLLAEMASIDRLLLGAQHIEPADSSALIARIKTLAVTTPQTRVIPNAVHDDESPLAAMRSAPLSSTLDEASKLPGSMVSIEPQIEFPLEETSAAPVETPALVQALTGPPAVAIVEAPAAVPVRLSPPAQVENAGRSVEIAKTPDAFSVRVDTAKLDHLMDMVGEMVIAQSLIRHSPVLLTANDSRLIGDLSQLARVTAEVQRATMSMRMVPVGQLFQKIERVIRDLSRKANKQIVLQTSGMDTEVDKTVAEELSDPLLHMVRNSVDHGIEVAAERIAAGKNPTAQIRLSAYHQGGKIVIEISDDGRGLNAERIRAKAEQRNLVSPTTVLSDSEVYQLIFEPGFSTAEKITDVSGRGVGMDVVRRNVEKLRGRIETHSTLGQGTTFFLKLPLTLAIIDGLVVEVGQSHYIVPLSVVREIFRPSESAVFSVENREEMVLVREQLLPVVRLNQRLGIEGRTVHPSEGLLVVIESESKRYCLLVDDLLGKQEVVIKGLGEVFKNIPGLSGCAVLADGRVGLILDTDGIYRGRRR
jgi:two-component system chemotaxis sensor kinase CheA